MSFMEQEITGLESWYEVDGPYGREYVPADLVGSRVECFPACERRIDDLIQIPHGLRDYCENREAWSVELKQGYGARMTAPGFMDCTEWSVFDTVEEAQEYLNEYYSDDDEADGDA